MSNRYQAMFERLGSSGEGAFIPFVTVGDPSIEASVRLMRALLDAGADALELGIPFSDPVADGPVIQQAAVRALSAGATVERCWEAIAQVRESHPDAPIGLLTYANLVFHRSPAQFCADAARAGADSILVADLPTLEVRRLVDPAREAGLELVCVVPPNASQATITTVAELTGGYTYVQGRAGVTGADTAMQSPAHGLIQALAGVSAPPPVVGFGVSTPEHVRAALESGAAGAISGSAVVAIIERLGDGVDACAEELTQFVHSMKAATR